MTFSKTMFFDHRVANINRRTSLHFAVINSDINSVTNITPKKKECIQIQTIK